MKCQKCNSNRIMFINGKTSDRNYCKYINYEMDGYVPTKIGIDDGDKYIELNYCLDCGQIQGTWPIEEPDLSEWYKL